MDPVSTPHFDWSKIVINGCLNFFSSFYEMLALPRSASFYWIYLYPNEVEVKFVWQISYRSANGASQGKYFLPRSHELVISPLFILSHTQDKLPALVSYFNSLYISRHHQLCMSQKLWTSHENGKTRHFLVDKKLYATPWRLYIR